MQAVCAHGVLLFLNLIVFPLAAEEALENKEAGEWSEDMASNEPLPGEKEEVLPEELETLPSDRG